MSKELWEDSKQMGWGCRRKQGLGEEAAAEGRAVPEEQGRGTQAGRGQRQASFRGREAGQSPGMERPPPPCQTWTSLNTRQNSQTEN